MKCGDATWLNFFTGDPLWVEKMTFHMKKFPQQTFDQMMHAYSLNGDIEELTRLLSILDGLLRNAPLVSNEKTRFEEMSEFVRSKLSSIQSK